jgi:AcrR family transcriptional regulator
MPPGPDKKRPLTRPVGAPPPKDRDTETRILDAARAVFVRKGTSGARVQDIAAEAGVNQALVHYYFGSKDVLAERVFLEAASAVAGAFAPVPDPSLTLEQMIERFVVGYVRAVRQAPFIPAYLMAEAHHHPERLDALFEAAIGTVPATLMQTTLAHVERVIAERVAAGSMRPMSPRQLLVSVMALTVFPFVARPILVAAFRLDGDGFERFLDERIAELPGFIINALRP